MNLNVLLHFEPQSLNIRFDMKSLLGRGLKYDFVLLALKQLLHLKAFLMFSYGIKVFYYLDLNLLSENRHPPDFSLSSFFILQNQSQIIFICLNGPAETLINLFVKRLHEESLSRGSPSQTAGCSGSVGRQNLRGKHRWFSSSIIHANDEAGSRAAGGPVWTLMDQLSSPHSDQESRTPSVI